MNLYVLIGIICLIILIVVSFILYDHRESFRATTMDIKAACLFAVSDFDADDYQIVKDNSHDITFYIINNGLLTEYARKAAALPLVTLDERENTGWDLGAWKYGMEKYQNELSRYDFVILANNSCSYANNWKELLVDAIGYDMYGHSVNNLVESDKGPHLMTWFIIISKKLFNDPSFKAYFDNLKPTDRDYCILHHEARFTDHFKDKGFKVGIFAHTGKIGDTDSALKKKGRTPKMIDEHKKWARNYTPKYAYY